MFLRATMQLNLFEYKSRTASSTTNNLLTLPTRNLNYLAANTLIAKKLRETADGMQSEINSKLNSPIMEQRQTQRRAFMAEAIVATGKRLQTIQGYLYKLADAWDDGTVPPILGKIRTKKALESLLGITGLSRLEKEYCPKEIYASWKEHKELLTDLTKIGITSAELTIEAIDALLEFNLEPPEPPTILKIQGLQRKLIGKVIFDYFPSPPPVARRVVEKAQIQPGETVLEPHGGSGELCDAVLEFCPDALLEVVEIDFDLQNLLILKGYNLVGSDCLKLTGSYNKIVANPPFTKGADCLHVRHLYEQCLAPKGRLVSIMSPAWLKNNRNPYKDFRNWFELMNGKYEHLPEGSFKTSKRYTGVSTILITLDKY
ncbi:DNA-methyltransferase [Crinalium epipsammum PCC 9333]|uniref:DNA-methyltransferase n=2 Tax=Crinalium TaxID=241421 RepID=K9VU05_9CYAN|nr:DNA-methyltransferase [Crinalium epipsammum PCC 9333]